LAFLKIEGHCGSWIKEGFPRERGQQIGGFKKRVPFSGKTFYPKGFPQLFSGFTTQNVGAFLSRPFFL